MILISLLVYLVSSGLSHSPDLICHFLLLILENVDLRKSKIYRQSGEFWTLLDQQVQVKNRNNWLCHHVPMHLKWLEMLFVQDLCRVSITYGILAWTRWIILPEYWNLLYFSINYFLWNFNFFVLGSWIYIRRASSARHSWITTGPFQITRRTNRIV